MGRPYEARLSVALKRVIDTRWSARCTAVRVLHIGSDWVVNALDELNDANENLDTRQDAHDILDTR